MESASGFRFERENQRRAKRHLVNVIRTNADRWRRSAEFEAIEEAASTYHLMVEMAIAAEGIDQAQPVPATTRGEALVTGYLLGYSYQRRFNYLSQIPMLSLPSYENIIDAVNLAESSETISLRALTKIGQQALEEDEMLASLFYELQDDLLDTSALKPFYEAGGGFCSPEFEGTTLRGYAASGINDLETVLEIESEVQRGVEEIERYLEDK